MLPAFRGNAFGFFKCPDKIINIGKAALLAYAGNAVLFIGQ